MSELHIAARTAMHQAAVVLANLADARNSTLDAEEMALIQARLADMNRAFVETGLLAAPAQELSALPGLPKPTAWKWTVRAWVTTAHSQHWGYSTSTDTTQPPKSILESENFCSMEELFSRAQTKKYGLLCRQQSTSDTARLDRLEAWRLNSLAKGFEGDTFQLTVDRPIREQLDAVQAQVPVQGRSDAALGDMDEAQWEVHKAKLAAKYPGIAAGYAVVEVLIETESGCDIEAGEWGFSVPRILHGAIKRKDLEAIEDCIAEDISDLKLPTEGFTSFIVYESGEWQDVFWTKFYRFAAIQAQAGDATKGGGK